MSRRLIACAVAAVLIAAGGIAYMSSAWAVVDHLTLTTPASAVTLTSGAVFTTQPVVALQDSSGVTDTSATATVYATVSGSASLIGTPSVSAVSGVATFSGLGIIGTVGATYTVTYFSGTYDVATQAVTVAAAGSASKLAITTDAAGAVSGAGFTTQPVVEIRDAGGSRVTSSTASVTAIASLGAVEIGTTTVAAVAGVATFASLGLTGTAGSTYTLTFTSGSLTVASQSITIIGAASARHRRLRLPRLRSALQAVVHSPLSPRSPWSTRAAVESRLPPLLSPRP